MNYKTMGKREWINCLSRLVDVYWDLNNAGYKSEAKNVYSVMTFVDEHLESLGRFGAMSAEIAMKKESEE